MCETKTKVTRTKPSACWTVEAPLSGAMLCIANNADQGPQMLSACITYLNLRVTHFTIRLVLLTFSNKVYFNSLPPPRFIFYLMDFRVTSLTCEWIQSYNTSLACITIVHTTMEGVGDALNKDFAAKISAGTGIRTYDLLTSFFFVAATPSIHA